MVSLSSRLDMTTWQERGANACMSQILLVSAQGALRQTCGRSPRITIEVSLQSITIQFQLLLGMLLGAASAAAPLVGRWAI